MQAVLGNALVLVIFNLGGGEIVVILALVFILFGARRLPDLGRGLGRGIYLFGKAIDGEAEDAGRSVGGIYGKPAAQAITPDNQVAEVYDPAVFHEDEEARKRYKVAGFDKLWRLLLRLTTFLGLRKGP